MTKADKLMLVKEGDVSNSDFINKIKLLLGTKTDYTELEDEQILLCKKEAENIWNLLDKQTKYKNEWVERYAYALSLEMTGLIRSKFQSIPIPGGDVKFNYLEFLNLGREERTKLENQVL